MNRISRMRFEALAAYCRSPLALASAKELAWFEVGGERLLIVLSRHREDEDFVAAVLAPDADERFRCVWVTDFFPEPSAALEDAERRLPSLLERFDEERVQGDERGQPVDFFLPVVPETRLHPSFVALTTLEGYSPALELIKPMMRWYDDADGNFVEQFQTTGFDARMWELYLFAALSEAGYALDRSAAVPDFVAEGLLGGLCVEATTVNPSRDAQGNVVPPPMVTTLAEALEFERHYMPIRFAGPLTAKLGKKYWERPNVAGEPLVIAIQDFHAPMSMTWSRAGLPVYLYGLVHDWRHEPDGKLVIEPKKIEKHRWGVKEVPSGFFNLPGAENISAVIANPSATISKFDRMGVVAGFGSKRVRLVREGLVASFDPNASEPDTFSRDVNSPEYSELWMEGMDVYHNPNAKHPLDPVMLIGAAHHSLQADGQIKSLLPAWQPMSSRTLITIDETGAGEAGAREKKA